MERNPNALPKGYKLKGQKGKVYTIGEVVGKGGCGITYLVTTVEYMQNIPIEVKLVVKEYFNSTCCMRDHNTQIVTSTPGSKELVEQGLHDFYTEAERLESLCGLNSNIVKVNEAFKANGTAYYVMEYLEGGDLTRYCLEHGKNGRLSEGEALHLMSAVCNAVNFLHHNKLLHLDIKPENVMLRRDLETQELTPVLIDFGLTRHYDKKGNPTTSSISSGHSDGYAPMEQYIGINSFEPTADVYAMGALLYYMLKGERPATADERISTYLQANMPETVTEKTKNAILHAMNSSKWERTQRVDLLAEELGIKMGDGTVIYGRTNGKKKEKKEKKKKEEHDTKEWLELLREHLALIIIVVLSVVLVWLFLGRSGHKEGGGVAESVANENVKRILNDKTKAWNVDSIVYAVECSKEGEVETEVQKQLDAIVDIMFDSIVKCGDNKSLDVVKANCYRSALRLKDDAEVRRKLKRIE